MPIAFIYRTDAGLVKRQVTAQHIGEAERVLGVRLPQDFADFLMAHDGPTPIPGWYPAQTPQGTVWHGPIVTLTSTAGPRMGRLGLRNDCIEGNTQMRRDQERLPKHFVSVGMMFTQPRMLLLSTADSERGAVYAWHIGDRRFKPEQTVRIAASFSEFLGLLTEPPPEVATVFRRVLADTLAEASADCGGPFPHLRCAQALRNIRPFVDLPAIQRLIDTGLDTAGALQNDGDKVVHLRAVIRQVLDVLRAEAKTMADPQGVTSRCRAWESDGPEARAWLRRNRNPSALASNHFGSTKAARDFVDDLYTLGAPHVLVPETSIRDDDDMGPYADSLVVQLPTDPKARVAVCRRCEREMDEPTTLDPNDTAPLTLWWD